MSPLSSSSSNKNENKSQSSLTTGRRCCTTTTTTTTRKTTMKRRQRGLAKNNNTNNNSIALLVPLPLRLMSAQWLLDWNYVKGSKTKNPLVCCKILSNKSAAAERTSWSVLGRMLLPTSHQKIAHQDSTTRVVLYNSTILIRLRYEH
jgi:hypothetical protein